MIGNLLPVVSFCVYVFLKLNAVILALSLMYIIYLTVSCGSVCQERNNEEVYRGATADHNAFLQWANEKCVPLVRELTFENAEVIVFIQ